MAGSKAKPREAYDSARAWLEGTLQMGLFVFAGYLVTGSHLWWGLGGIALLIAACGSLISLLYFIGYWTSVAETPEFDPRDRTRKGARWLGTLVGAWVLAGAILVFSTSFEITTEMRLVVLENDTDDVLERAEFDGSRAVRIEPGDRMVIWAVGGYGTLQWARDGNEYEAFADPYQPAWMFVRASEMPQAARRGR